MGSVYFIAVLLCMFSCQRKIIRNPLFLIVATVLLFYAAFSVNNTAIGQQAIDNANRTVSLNSAPENEAIVAIPTPSADDLSPETEQQQAGTNEDRGLENSDESNDDNRDRGKVEQAEIQKDKVSESDQTREDGQEQLSENEEKEDNSDAREEENDIDDHESDDDEDVPFVLPFP
jgi:type IV secretory pathway VirB10-like protein